MNYTLEKILEVISKKEYPLNSNDDKNYNLNIVGVRANPGEPNKFDDIINVFWKYQGKWTLRVFPATTDPGKYYLANPMNVEGTSVVKEGYYAKLWQLGLHQGKYLALRQVNKVKVYRDNDLDEMPETQGMKEYEGIFGINCHRANANGQSTNIDKWSAGCQVLQNKQINNPDNQMVKVFEFDYFMHLCNLQAEKAQKNYFDYTLLNQKDFV